MTAGAFPEPRRGRAGRSFADASPADVRAALILGDQRRVDILVVL
jgi:hypothetical protein